MSFLRSLKLFFRGSNSSRRLGEIDTFQQTGSGARRNFTADYNAAVQIIKQRMDDKFPDNYQANFRTNRDYNNDYGATRAEAVDTASAAIAAALRKGATVRQAAEAGAASVGI